jgi:N-acyl-D-aspartate/D-glutamate deacylase
MLVGLSSGAENRNRFRITGFSGLTPDLVIRGGLVIDGSGAPPRHTDVAVVNDRILAVDAIESSDCAQIDASGLVVAPGFIDIHSHSDYTLLVDPRAESAIHQGVTLELVGNCGHGCFPLREQSLSRRAIYGISDRRALDWTSAAEYFDRVEAAKPAVNVASLVPNGQLRMSAMGVQNRIATSDEVASMARHLEESLDAGAFGLSTGLEYAAEAGAGREEIARLCGIVAHRGGLYATHTRFRDQGAVEAVREAIDTARETGVRLQISHLLPRGGSDDCRECVRAVDDALLSGQDLAFDMHTRLFGLTFLHAMLPPWFSVSDPNRVRELLQQPAMRRDILAHRSIVTASGNWKRLVLLDNPIYPQYSRLNFEQIALERGQAPGEAAIDLLAGSVDAAVPPMVISWLYDAADQELAFAHDHCIPGSDATTLCMTGPLSGSEFHGAYSWAAFFFRFSVRERGFFRPEEAIRRLTGTPASILGLSDRGLLAAGNYADIAVFDPASFGETTTTFQPNSLAQGMRYVLVNGQLTLEDGRLTGARAGRVLRRSGR